MKIFCPVCGEEIEIDPSVEDIVNDSYQRKLVVRFEEFYISHEHLGA